MAMWPFRRKSRRKRVRASTTDFEDARGRAVESSLPPRSQTLQDLTVPMPVPEPEQSNRKQRPEPNKLQRRQRTYSFSPGRRDSIGPHRRRSVRAQRQPHGPAPNTTTGDTPVGWRRTREDRGAEKEMGMMRDDDLRRVPTLHNKRDGDDLPRKKSSKKRRRNDHQREAEIKAMSNFVPLRRATEDWTGGHPAGMDGRRVRTSFGLGFKGSSRQEWDKYNRSSDISLPAESIHSAHSSDSEYLSFKVSALEALAPRPTLRYATHPRPGAEGGDFGMRLARASSRQQKKLSAPIPEATLKAHKRIHDLADELSASDLRELMERDQRRRDRKRQMDQERLEQRLARRAEKQRAAEAEAKRQGRDSPANLERGVLGREVLGLGTDPTSAVITSSRIRQSDESLKEKGKDAEIDPAAAPGDESRPHPLAAFHRTNSIPLQSPKLESLPAEPKKQPAQPLTSPRSRTSFIRLKLSRSSTPQGSDIKTEHSDPPQKGHETANSKAPLSWATFFRWGNKHKHRSAGPSSFSNTSRDSMQAAPQAPTPPANFIPRRLSAGVPKRTMSRFREDLPELPLSPPDSRIQSPEATAIPGATEPSALTNAVMEHVILAPPRQADRYDTPTSEQRSMEAMRQTPSTFGHPDEPSVSPELQTMSLASIDSEGSWLSGKMSKKRKPSGSLRATPYGQRPRTTSESDAEHIPDQDNNTNEEMSIAEDDYLARYTSSPVERPGWNRKSTGDPRPSSDGEEETHWGSVRGHQPQLVHSHTAGRVKSREVLLKSFGEEGEIDAVVSGSKNVDNDDDEDDEGETSGLQRATSINLGKEHVRHISAGSARLLSISPRSSVDTKRLSMLSNQDKAETS